MLMPPNWRFSGDGFETKDGYAVNTSGHTLVKLACKAAPAGRWSKFTIAFCKTPLGRHLNTRAQTWQPRHQGQKKIK